MPRYYCDYCDTYLTHDSPSVRKQHNAGYKHKANVRTYYQQFEEQQTQSLIDQRIKEHLGQAAALQHQVGAAFMSLPTNPGRPRLPLLAPPMMNPVAQGPLGSIVLPGVGPPVLPRPLIGAPTGYVAGPGILPGMMPPPGAAPMPPMQMPGLPRPPALNPMSTPGTGPLAPPNGGAPLGMNPAWYPSGSSSTAASVGPASATIATQDSFPYGQAPDSSYGAGER